MQYRSLRTAALTAALIGIAGNPLTIESGPDKRKAREPRNDAERIAAAKGKRAKKAAKRARIAARNVAAPNRDWTEDYEEENGNYQNRCVGCGAEFVGHKRRVICKKCALPPNAAFSGHESEVNK